MSKNKIFIIAGFLFLLSLNVFLKPYLEKREAAKIVQTVLKCWQKGDLLNVYSFWKDPKKSPPVYGLVSYAIINKSFLKKEGIPCARISVRLGFTPDNISPSGKEWVFELEKSGIGWQIIDFQLMH